MVQIDLHQPPGVIRPSPTNGLDHAVSLDWDQAVNDELHLRRCPVCGCRDLYARKRMPQITGFLAIVFAAIIAMILFGFGRIWWALGTFLVVLMLDVGIWLGAGKILVCYQCQAQFHGKIVPSRASRWDSAVAERYDKVQINPIQRAKHKATAPRPPRPPHSGDATTPPISPRGQSPAASSDSYREPVN